MSCGIPPLTFNRILLPSADFFLNAHAAIQGTSKPVKYTVILDENGFTSDGLQLMLYHMSWTYQRATRSVSIVPACYYAHHASAKALKSIDMERVDQDLQRLNQNWSGVTDKGLGMMFC